MISHIVPIPEDAFRVLITGDRHWSSPEPIAALIDSLPPNAVIIQGYADGADLMAHAAALTVGIPSICCPAHWNHHTKRYIEIYGPCEPDCAELCGRAAGMIRNHWMLDTYQPHVVHGFHDDIMESKGTKDMLKYAQKRGVPTYLHTSNGDIIMEPQLTKPRKSRKLPDVQPDTFFRITNE